jgi:hypothetical protein
LTEDTLSSVVKKNFLDDVIGEMVECEASVLQQPSTKALVKDYRVRYDKLLMSLLLLYLPKLENSKYNVFQANLLL